jgi:hypothetical protein
MCYKSFMHIFDKIHFLEYGQLEMKIYFLIVIGQIQVNLHHQYLMKHYMLVVHMQSK